MLEKTLLILAIIAFISAVGFLLIGAGGFAKGGEFNRKYSNKMMRGRIISQALAVMLIVAYIWVRDHY